jgi:hypothetical protein
MHLNLMVGSWCLVAATSALSLAATTDLRLIQAVKNNDLESLAACWKNGWMLMPGMATVLQPWLGRRTKTISHRRVADSLRANVRAANEDGAARFTGVHEPKRAYG